MAIATAIARADRVVVVPELEVYSEQLLPGDVERITEVALALADEQPGVVLAGLSFRGSLGLLAAADPQLVDQVRLVATFGAYADLAGVIQAVTTCVSLVADERLPACGARGTLRWCRSPGTARWSWFSRSPAAGHPAG
ncbi:MAG: hypothetical protein ACNA8R_01720 [Nitriliruptoraceae bacterium]